jgi:mono/diheme cytochrome c family protein
MTNQRFLAVVVLLIIGSTTLLTRGGQTTPSTPTFTKDVAPVLHQHCAGCHRAGEIAPMSLLTYEEARPWAKSIREEVANGEMPPWHAVAPRGTFSNDRRLSEQEKATLIRWVDGGAPREIRRIFLQRRSSPTDGKLARPTWS